jgi:transposase InsO family protein
MRVERIQGAYVPAKRRCGGGQGVLGVDGVRVWPDLVKRDFQPAGPNELWCSDLKQIPTGEGVLHLASVLDCFSCRIVGWAMGPVADAPLVADALRMAVSQRRPGEGIVHHADRGCEGRIQSVVATLDSRGVAMGKRRRASDRAIRAPMRSPVRPPGWRREHRQRFWAAIARGAMSEAAGVEAGVSPPLLARSNTLRKGRLPLFGCANRARVYAVREAGRPPVV